MYLNIHETTELKAIIRKCGLNTRAAGQLVTYFKHLEKHRGIKFLVSYMKDVTVRIKRGHPLHKLSGQGKYFHKLVSKGRQGKRYALRILALHGRWEASPAKKGDYVKFAEVVARVTPKRQDLHLKFLDEQIDQLRDAMSFARFSFQPLKSTKTHILRDNKSCRGISDISDELKALTEAGCVFLQFEEYLSQVFRIPTSARSLLRALARQAECFNRSYVGRVTCLTKDRSLKYRFIANLMKGWQVAISPCVFAFKEFLRRQEMSALNDQVGAVRWMVSELRAGKKITSVDLTQATDFLPMYLLEDALTSVLPQLLKSPDKRSTNFVEAYLLDLALIKSSFWTPFDKTYVSYGTGQPMGRWTSKYQLDILMMLLSQHVGGDGSNCRINGDDIFFSDPNTGRRFCKLLNYLQIPISDTKTFHAKDFGEFSGMIADKFGSYDVEKGTRLDVARDPLGPLRKYGPRGITLYPKKIRDMIWAIASLPEPYGVKKVRDQAGDPYMGFQPVVRSKPFSKFGWDPAWVEQVFQKEAIEILRQRCWTVLKFVNCPFLHPSNLQSIGERYDRLQMKLLTLQERSRFKGATQQIFHAPIQRLDLFADNLNSKYVKTSDNHVIDGYGDEAFDNLQTKATLKFHHVPPKENDHGRQLTPTLPIKWVRRVWNQLKRWLHWVASDSQ